MSAYKIFVSYHDGAEERHRARFEAILSEGVEASFIKSSPQLDGEVLGHEELAFRQRLREGYLRDTSITVLLISGELWKRRRVDWEISASLHGDEEHPRSGLVGIVLPSHYNATPGVPRGHYKPNSLPPRLYDNIEAGFASIHDWTEDSATLRGCEAGLTRRACALVRSHLMTRGRSTPRIARRGAARGATQSSTRPYASSNRSRGRVA